MMHLIKSEEQFDGVLAKIRDESSPAILYFTAAWCGPCRFMSPAIEALNEKYPHVTAYKIDIEQKCFLLLEAKVVDLSGGGHSRQIDGAEDRLCVDAANGGTFSELKLVLERNLCPEATFLSMEENS